MAQFDVFERRNGAGYLLDYQADVLSRLVTRFVVPLLPRTEVPTVVVRLNPIFLIADEEMVLMPQNVATVPARELSRWITSLEHERYVIGKAVDFLTGGY